MINGSPIAQEMVRYLSARYQRVHAIIGVNPNKKYDVSPYERQELFRAMLKEIGLTNVDVIIVCSNDIFSSLIQFFSILDFDTAWD